MAFKTFKTGARPTPRHKLAATPPHKIRGTTPAQVIVVPPFLEMWLNDQYGDCVTAEEAFAKAYYSVANGLPETKITDATVRAFCNKYNVLNGAGLTEVMDAMIADGFHQDGITYKDGGYTGVDYSNEALLQNAISIGPVKIGIDANALPGDAGNANGWSAFGGRPGEFGNEDHNVAICGYGPTAALFQALGVPVPSGAPANGYFLYTWSTIGVVDHAWIMSTCGEAWLRDPTTPGIGPTPPDPTPDPIPIPPGPTPQSLTIPSLQVAWGGVTIPGLATVPMTIPISTFIDLLLGKSRIRPLPRGVQSMSSTLSPSLPTFGEFTAASMWLVNAVKSGTLSKDRQASYSAAWIVAGYGGLFIPESAPSDGMKAPLPLTDDEFCDHLTAATSGMQADVGKNRPWMAIILKAFELLLPLLVA